MRWVCFAAAFVGACGCGGPTNTTPFSGIADSHAERVEAGVPEDVVEAEGSECVDAGHERDAGSEQVIVDACSVALMRVGRIDGECSGAGGDHVTFQVEHIARGPNVTSVARGGHAYYAGDDNIEIGAYFVAALEPLGALTDLPERNNPGWCLVGLPRVDALAVALIRVPNRQAGIDLLDSLARGR